MTSDSFNSGRRLQIQGELDREALNVKNIAAALTYYGNGVSPGFRVERIPSDRVSQLRGDLLLIFSDNLKYSAEVKTEGPPLRKFAEVGQLAWQGNKLWLYLWGWIYTSTADLLLFQCESTGDCVVVRRDLMLPIMAEHLEQCLCATSNFVEPMVLSVAVNSDDLDRVPRLGIGYPLDFGICLNIYKRLYKEQSSWNFVLPVLSHTSPDSVAKPPFRASGIEPFLRGLLAMKEEVSPEPLALRHGADFFLDSFAAFGFSRQPPHLLAQLTGTARFQKSTGERGAFPLYTPHTHSMLLDANGNPLRLTAHQPKVFQRARNGRYPPLTIRERSEYLAAAAAHPRKMMVGAS